MERMKLGNSHTINFIYKGKKVGESTPAMRNRNIALIERAKIEDPIVAKYFEKRVKWLSKEAQQITVSEEM